jgi:glycosyltransferase involved in cell wall biosynthesis
MAVILFYSPFNQRSRDTESLMIAFRKQGHRVISLTQQEGFVINDFLKANDVEAYSYLLPGRRGGWRYYLKHILYFIRFCNKHKVDIVYSHLEPANFVASIGQFFIRGTTFLCRHHIDEGKLYSFDKDLYYRITYRLARKIIVVSDHARRYMIEREGIPSRKILHINLAYDFDLYGSVDHDKASEIRKMNNADVLLLSACRFTTFKRPDYIVLTLKKLVDLGVDAKLIMLGMGEMQSDIEQQIRELGLSGRVRLGGYVSNVLDYMAAADYFIHPSVLDSSCVAVKEAGLTKLPVIVCRGVGDFDDYIVNNSNGFAVEKENFPTLAADIVHSTHADKNLLKNIGENLNKSVLELFSIQHVIVKYDSLNYNAQ